MKSLKTHRNIEALNNRAGVPEFTVEWDGGDEHMAWLEKRKLILIEITSMYQFVKNCSLDTESFNP